MQGRRGWGLREGIDGSGGKNSTPALIVLTVRRKEQTLRRRPCSVMLRRAIDPPVNPFCSTPPPQLHPPTHPPTYRQPSPPHPRTRPVLPSTYDTPRRFSADLISNQCMWLVGSSCLCKLMTSLFSVVAFH